MPLGKRIRNKYDGGILTKTTLSEKEGEADVYLKENIGDNPKTYLGVAEHEALGGVILALLRTDLDYDSNLRLPAADLGCAASPGASIL